ncbi:hypothetical protein [Caballeronia jiangsuensis]
MSFLRGQIRAFIFLAPATIAKQSLPKFPFRALLLCDQREPFIARLFFFQGLKEELHAVVISKLLCERGEASLSCNLIVRDLLSRRDARRIEDGSFLDFSICSCPSSTTPVAMLSRVVDSKPIDAAFWVT